jgi:biopolymer transport protein ExbD
MTSITQPLQFRRYLTSKPKPGFDFVAWVDLLLLFAFLAVSANSYLSLPGQTVALPRSAQEGRAETDAVLVLTVQENQLYFLLGKKIAEGQLENHLEEARASMSSSRGDPMLLIKAAASISAEDLFELIDLAERTGFERVHLAAEANGNSASNRSSKEPDE